MQPPPQPGNGNGPGIMVDPQEVINALLQRVQQLTMENVMLQAALNQRQVQDTIAQKMQTEDVDGLGQPVVH